MAPRPPELVAEPMAESTIRVNLRSDLGKARHGSEIKADFSSKNAFWASSGRGPPFHKESLRVNLLRGPEKLTKISYVRAKKICKTQKLFDLSYI